MIPALRASRVLLAAVVLLVVVPGAASADEPSTGRNVLVLALPTLEWGDLYAGDTPSLDALLDGSAVASLSVRGVHPTTDAAAAYATMSAGTRCEGVTESGQVLEAAEPFAGGSALEAFRRDRGEPVDSGLLSFGFAPTVRRNAALAYDAEVGALGQALMAAGTPRAAIANADGYATDEARWQRVGATALVDRRGVVPAGAVSAALLAEDPDAPFGVVYDLDAVLTAFDEAWSRGGVVLVEGSDLAREDRYRARAAEDERPRLRRAALRRTDALVAGLLERVDPERDSVLVVAPYHAAERVHLTVAGLRAPGVEPGLLRSASTRRAGFVTLVDVAPTVLELAGVEAPASMEGRPVERVSGGQATGPARARHLTEVDEAARYRDRMVTPVALVFVALQAALWVGAVLAITRGGARARRLVAVAALALLVYLPVTYLAGFIAFQDLGGLAYWAFLGSGAVVGAGVAMLVGRRGELDPLIAALGAVFGLLVVDVVLGARLQLNTVFGYSPTVGGRFAGMGNLAYGQFAGAAFLLCGLISRRLAGRSYATAAAFAVLVVALVVDGTPVWGSDVGGVLAFVPAFGVTAFRLLGRRPRWRHVMLWGVLALGATATFAVIDLQRPDGERTHLGRLVESVLDRGWGSLATVVGRKLEANLSVITSSVWTAMVPIALGFVVYLLWRAPGQVRLVRDTIPEALGGLAVVGFLGFALNDSGIAVPGVMLGVVNASLVYLTVRAPVAADAVGHR